MIEYAYEAGNELVDSKKYTKWLKKVVTEEGATVGAICYIFTSDEKVHEINKASGFKSIHMLGRADLQVEVVKMQQIEILFSINNVLKKGCI